MKLLTGSVYYTADPRGRLCLPAAWYRQLGRELALTWSPGGLLLGFPAAAADAWLQDAGALAAYYRAGLCLVPITAAAPSRKNGIGRFLPPAPLRAHAGIRAGVECVLFGCGDHFGIQRADRYDALKASTERQMVEWFPAWLAGVRTGRQEVTV